MTAQVADWPAELQADRARPQGPRPPPSALMQSFGASPEQPFAGMPPPPLPEGALPPCPPSPRSSPRVPISFRNLPTPPSFDLEAPPASPQPAFLPMRPPASGATLFRERRQSRLAAIDAFTSPASASPSPSNAGRASVIPDPMRTVKGPGNSIFVHKGMWDLLGIVRGDRGDERDESVRRLSWLGQGKDGWDAALPTPQLPSPAPPQAPLPKAPEAVLMSPRPPLVRRAVIPSPALQAPSRPTPLATKSAPTPSTTSQGWFAAFVAPAKGKENRRISVDMIGRPSDLRHLAHASDADQAEAILYRWKEDGVGKNAEPGWADPIKEATRPRATAQGICEVATAHHQSDAPLKIVNGVPSSIISPLPTPSIEPTSAAPTVGDFTSVLAVEDGRSAKSPVPSPMWQQKEAEEEAMVWTETIVVKDDEYGLGKLTPTRPPLPSFEAAEEREKAKEVASDKPVTPSLTTLEKAVAVKVYLENHYYDVLKRPRDRDARQALLEKELSHSRYSDAERQAIRRAFASTESDHLRDLRSRVGANSFVKLKTIGHGAFGVVSLVRERSSGELFAMKQLRKADMLRHGQEGYVRAERDVMTAASSVGRWIVRLAYSFQDVDHLYLVMEYMGGGDLLTLLIARDKFSEGMTRFYMAEMVLAVEEAHKLGYIHRDIKPDNFLFDRNGHIKISDFGLATDFHWAHDAAYYQLARRALLSKHGIDLEDGATIRKTGRNKAYADLFRDGPEEGSGGGGRLLTCRDKNRRKLAYSVVGTNNYMAPEVLRGMGYDQACDWWSLGIIMFEMLFGFPTFVSSSRHATRQKILQWKTNLRFPTKPRISREAQQLIEGLLCDREDRLGSRTSASKSRPNSQLMAQRMAIGNASGGSLRREKAIAQDGADEIKAHPWFAGVDFENIHRQKAPFVPKLKNDTDTRYFDEDIDANPLPPPNGPLPDTAVDPLLRNKQHGARLLELRKQLAFAGYTFKGPRRDVFDPRFGIFTDADAVRGHLAVLKTEDPEALGQKKVLGPGPGREPMDVSTLKGDRIRSVSM